MNIRSPFPDDVVRATVEAGFLVLVPGRNVGVGPLAQNLWRLSFHCQLERATDKQHLCIR
jgi:hypothetical protein